MNKEFNNDLGFYLKKLNNHIEREMYVQYKKYGIKEYSLMNMMVINFLCKMREADKIVFQKDVEEEFFINKATASKMLTLMEEKELIKRIVLEEDARLKKIVILPLGEELQKSGEKIILNLEEKLKRGIEDKEIDLFKELCKKIIKNMEE